MGLELSFGSQFVNTLRNPGGKFNLTVHDGAFPTVGFDQDEANIFRDQMNQLIMDLDSSMVTHLLLQRQETIARVASFSKQVFDEKNFEGINAGDNAIGFSVLRPGHIYQDDTGTIQNSWYTQPGVTDAFFDWIGDGTAANNYTFGEDQVSVVLGFIDQDTDSEISAINVDEFGRNMDMLPIDVNDARLMDNETDLKVVPLPSLVGQENDNVHIRLRADRDVESQPRLLGFTFGLGTFLNTEDY